MGQVEGGFFMGLQAKNTSVTEVYHCPPFWGHGLEGAFGRTSGC